MSTRYTRKEPQQIRITDLRRLKVLEKGVAQTKTLRWPDGSAVTCRMDEPGGTMELAYQVTQEGETVEVRQKIALDRVTTNLPNGKGTIEYFVCPETGKRCRTLYRMPHTREFVSLHALPRLYHPSQLLSRTDALAEEWNEIERQLKTSVPHKSHYRGKPTTTMQRFNRLLDRQAAIEREALGFAMQQPEDLTP